MRGGLLRSHEVGLRRGSGDLDQVQVKNGRSAGET